jgi:hypothetical protein
VKPYQPAGLWETATSGRGILATYRQDHHDSLYRRGLYTFIKLTVPPPEMGLFDASNRDQCEVQRLRTNTPLQALLMLNDPTVLEAARVLAQRLESDPALPVDDKIVKAFRLILCRRPADAELSRLKGYYADQLAEFKKDPDAARKTIHVGEYPQPVREDIVPTAALMRVIDVLYNLEETIMKT